MSAEALKAKIVHVRREQGEGGWFYATSPDLKGLLVTEPTLDELDRSIPQAIADLYAACGDDVIVTRVEADQDHMRGWLAIPALLASQALARKSSAGAAR